MKKQKMYKIIILIDFQYLVETLLSSWIAKIHIASGRESFGCTEGCFMKNLENFEIKI